MELEYTAVIRTLGTAGEKYQQLLNSLMKQSIPPQKIIVYIAEGYPLPKETVGIEEYIYVKKGMVAQRALPYDEVETTYILFLDDDLSFSADFVEKMYKLLRIESADVISPDIYPNSSRSFLGVLMMFVSGRMLARKDDGKWGYKVMRNTGYSYNNNPQKNIYISQTNAGACFFCKKETFLSISFEDELWLDEVPYAIGDDQAMYYKMYMSHLKILTWYNCGIVHLDAGGNISSKREKQLIYNDFRFKTIFWHRFIFLPEESRLLRLWAVLCIGYTFSFGLFISLLKGRFDILALKYKAICSGINFIRSEEYARLPKIQKNV